MRSVTLRRGRRDVLLCALGLLPSLLFGLLAAPAGAATAAGDLTRAGLRQPGGLSDCLPEMFTAQAEPISGGSAPVQVGQIGERVEQLRGHVFEQRVDPRFMTSEAVRKRVLDETMAAYPPETADHDRRLLAALGAVPRTADLRRLQADLLGGQVAGFYDAETGELVVRADDPDAALGALTQVVLAHELTHALTDDVLRFPREALEGDSSDGALAALALVEGDAVLAQQQFSAAAIPLEQQLMLLFDPTIVQAQSDLAGVPHLLRSELEFPYVDGLAFVCGLHGDGGWTAVDAAYAHPPVTTAQVLFPERYAAQEQPVNARDPQAPGPEWHLALVDTLGAARLKWLFEAPGDNPNAGLDHPLEAAGAWAGGEAHLFTDSSTEGSDQGQGTAVAVALVDRSAGGGLCTSVGDWYQAAFPNDRASSSSAGGQSPPSAERLVVDGADQDAVLLCDGREVRLGIAPDLATARALVR